MEVSSQAVIGREIARSTRQLTEVLALGGLGAKGAFELDSRIAQITTLIQENPVRVTADLVKPVQHRTEHDKQRAHMIACAINDDECGNAGLRARQWGRTAAEIYDDDPIGAHPEMITYFRTIIGDAISKQLF